MGATALSTRRPCAARRGNGPLADRASLDALSASEALLRPVGVADAAEPRGEARLRGLEGRRVVVAPATAAVGDHLRHEVLRRERGALGPMHVSRRGSI